MLDEMLNGCLQKCWAPYGLQRWKGDYVGRGGGGYLSFRNVWHSLTPMQRRHSMITYDQKHLSVPLTSYQLADTFQSIPTQQGISGNHFMNYLLGRLKSLIVCLIESFCQWLLETLKRIIMLKLLFTSKRSKWLAHFLDDLTYSVKWHLDEALQSQTPAEYILSLPAQTYF